MPLGASVTEAGVMATEAEGELTVIVAVAVLLESAWLVAITWKVPVLLGVVYRPALVIVPPAVPSCTFQATAVLADPVTVAVKVWVAPSTRSTVRGVMLTVTCEGNVEPPPPQPEAAMNMAISRIRNPRDAAFLAFVRSSLRALVISRPRLAGAFPHCASFGTALNPCVLPCLSV